MKKLFLLLASLSLFAGAYANDEVASDEQSEEATQSSEVVQEADEDEADSCCSEAR